ncbi:alpha/beta fold hydrolase [Streptomyces sp. NBC_00503]|uniref:alpha/beta fold hydrolase n=1 Tax=Streptomyces sp. NBC_00503 TaxID=2903659 RepID=UPI002E80D73F|nr:alpha/beta hydrolase [Streptomyces sp. NBC_00503]WUD82666.1 alpha/beta hydrolase [Streptomyces sp. NBC_00503]
MPFLRAGGPNLYYEVVGEGEPLVLVHGSWNDHTSWQPAIEADIRASFRVLSYDRRGHGQSEAGPLPGTRRQDEDDLAALIEELGPAPAHVAGNSFGAATVLGLAARRPELFRTITAHEPPLMAMVAGDPAALAEMGTAGASIEAVLGLLRKGEYEQGARLFVEEVAMGPGTWDRLPQRARDTFVHNAPTFLDEQSDPDWATVDLEGLSRCEVPVLLSGGTESPAWLGTVLDHLAEALPRARRQRLEGAGHIPHVTHPQEYVAALTRFIGEG